MNVFTWTDGKGTRDKLGQKRADIVNVSDRGAVQKSDQLRNARTTSRGAKVDDYYSGNGAENDANTGPP